MNFTLNSCSTNFITLLKINHVTLFTLTMKSSIRDKAEGTFHEVKGKVKEISGKLSDNPELEAEGTGEKIAGKVQKKIGKVKKVLGK